MLSLQLRNYCLNSIYYKPAMKSAKCFCNFREVVSTIFFLLPIIIAWIKYIPTDSLINVESTLWLCLTFNLRGEERQNLNYISLIYVLNIHITQIKLNSTQFYFITFKFIIITNDFYIEFHKLAC